MKKGVRKDDIANMVGHLSDVTKVKNEDYPDVSFADTCGGFALRTNCIEKKLYKI